MMPDEQTHKSVLVIEDDHDIRETFRQLLELEGYPVITAANGKEGLEKLRRLPPPALILLDLMMPVMNGWEFLTAQRADESIAKIPVVVVTAVGGNGRDTLKTAGYLKKPVELQSLLDAVKEYCG
jgi:CheY-like chemotaxis protein